MVKNAPRDMLAGCGIVPRLSFGGARTQSSKLSKSSESSTILYQTLTVPCERDSVLVLFNLDIIIIIIIIQYGGSCASHQSHGAAYQHWTDRRHD